jgi:hypothetical protein
VESVGTVLIAFGLAVSACGGATKSSLDREPSPGGGASNGAGSSGAPAGGSSAGQGAAGSGGAGGIASSGGSRPMTEPQAGSNSSAGAPNPLGCDEPSGGPRPDGPEPIIGACDAISDEVLVARFQSYADRVPKGFFYDAKPWDGLLLEPCSHSSEETAAYGATVGLIGLAATFTTPWLYEASFCGDGPRRSVRNLRCDYFDGHVLAPRTPQDLAFLASIRWWGENHDDDATALLGYSITSGDATAWVEVCSLSGRWGNAGVCHEIRLERTRYSLFHDGKVTVNTPQLVRILRSTSDLCQ